MDGNDIWGEHTIKLAAESINYKQIVREFVVLLSLLFVFEIHQTLTNKGIQLPRMYL